MGSKEFQEKFQRAEDQFGRPHHSVDEKAWRERARHDCYAMCGDEAPMPRMVDTMAATHTTFQIQRAYN